MFVNKLFSFTVFILSLNKFAISGKQLSMKVVKEPSNYGLNVFNQQASSQQNTLKLRTVPSNFSGPIHLRYFVGKCFEKATDEYKYIFCPFDNITQHEVTLRWNPFRGVLGVWKEWQIENNTFAGMLMEDGDICGSRFRSTKVEFQCSDVTEVLNITEPSTCDYLVTFKTPLVCHPQSMLVYPTLSRDLQEEWNILEGKLLYDIVTPQGYSKRLKELFIKAGYMLDKEEQERLVEIRKKKAEMEKLEKGDFDTLAECQTEYRKLREELNSLKIQLAQISSNVTRV